MTKHKHHPHTRAERLALKELDEKPKANRAAKVWRKLNQESLKEWESRRELEKVADGRDSEGKHP